MTNKQLYESIMIGIDKALYNELNEAYTNMLFEEFNFKDFFDKAIQKTKTAANAIKNKAAEMKIDATYKFAKQYIAAIIEKINETKGKQAALKFINELKAEMIELLKESDIEPKQVIISAKILAVGVLSAIVVGQIEKAVKADMDAKFQEYAYQTYGIENTFVENPLEIEYKKYDKLPVEYFKDNERFQMKPTKACVKLIYNHEVPCMYPYYSNKRERAAGVITIGIGHVIFNGEDWILPKCLSPERRQKLKNDVIKYRKLIVKSQCENGVNKERAKGMPDLLTMDEALKIFQEDIDNADLRVRQTLGLKKCENSKYNVYGKINTNVGLYCYYNQNIYDALVAFTFNAGTLKNTIKLSERLQRCRYDEKMNRINDKDYAFTFEAYKEGNGYNLDRRADEYEAFKLGDTRQILKIFSNEVHKD